MQQVEQQDGHLGICQEQRLDVALGKIGADGGIIGEVSVVHQGLVHADERVSATGMPHLTFRRIAMVPDPDMGTQVFQPVIAHDIIAIANHLEDEHVFPV